MCGEIAILVFLSPLKKESQVILHLPPGNSYDVALIIVFWTCVTKNHLDSYMFEIKRKKHVKFTALTKGCKLKPCKDNDFSQVIIPQ